MKNIYDIQGNLLMQVPVTPECEHVEELMRTDEVRLAWNAAEDTALPDGAYVEVPDGGEKYYLNAPYTPTQKKENVWRYEPVFVSAFYALSKVPFYMYTYEDGDPTHAIIAREADWVLTTDAAGFMDAICRAILNESGGALNYTFAVAQDLPASKTVTFSSVDIISALNAIANAFETEFWLEKYPANDPSGYTGRIHLSFANDGASAKVLTVGTNVNVPSVTGGREGFYNRFVVLGSTRNITQDYQGAGVNSVANKRLTLNPTDYPNGYIDYSNGGKPYTKILVFDDIYPVSNLRIKAVLARTRYVLDDNDEPIVIQPGQGSSPDIYDLYNIYYVKLEQYNETSQTWEDFVFNNTDYDADTNPTGMRLPNMPVSIHFSSGPLRGREFELKYLDNAIINAKDKADTTTFSCPAGYFEVIKTQEGNYIIPSLTGLVPAVNDQIVLFNIKMPDEYVSGAQDTLEARAFEEIGKNYIKLNPDGTAVRDTGGNLIPVDKNSYQLTSNPVAFGTTNPGLKLASAVTYVNGDYSLSTRVKALVTKLDYGFKQTITIGEEVTKGTIQELKEEAANANQNIDVLDALSQSTQRLLDAYNRTQELIQARQVDTFFQINADRATEIDLRDAYQYLGPKNGLVFGVTPEASYAASPADLMVREVATGNNTTQRVLYTPLPLITGGDQIVENGTPGGGGGGGAGYLYELLDFSSTISSKPSAQKIIAFDPTLTDKNGNAGAWKYVDMPIGSVTSVAGVSPVSGDIPVADLKTALGITALSGYGVATSVLQTDTDKLVTGAAVYSAIASAVSSVLKFVGTTTSNISDGSTTNPIVINGSSYTAVTGNVVLKGNKEFLWNGSSWEEMGDEASWALKTVTITGTGYLTGGGTLEQNRTIDIASTYKGYIDEGHSAYGWGNHANAGYLLASVAATTYHPKGGDTQSNTFKIGGATFTWTPASGSTPGYLTLDSAFISQGDQIVISGTPGGGGGGGSQYLYELLDVNDNLQSPAKGTMIWWSGSEWVRTSASSPAAGNVLQYNNNAWGYVAATSIGITTDATQSAHGLMSTADKTKLDGINLANYLPLAGGTMTGTLTISNTSYGNYTEGIRLTRAGNGWVGITFGSTGTSGAPTGGWFVATNPNGAFVIVPDDTGGSGLILTKGSDPTWAGNTIWHAGNLTPGNYLPLSAGSLKPLTGSLYLSSGTGIYTGSYGEAMIYQGSTNGETVVGTTYGTVLIRTSNDHAYHLKGWTNYALFDTSNYTSWAVSLTTSQTITAKKTISTASYGNQLEIYRNEANYDSVIKFSNKDDGVLGYLGVRGSSSNKVPCYSADGITAYTLYHTGNLSPLTTTNYGSYCLPLAGGKTITGDFSMSAGVALRIGDPSGGNAFLYTDSSQNAYFGIYNRVAYIRTGASDNVYHRKYASGGSSYTDYEFYDKSNSNKNDVPWSAAYISLNSASGYYPHIRGNGSFITMSPTGSVTAATDDAVYLGAHKLAPFAVCSGQIDLGGGSGNAWANLYLANNKIIYFEDSGGTSRNIMWVSSSNDFIIGRDLASCNTGNKRVLIEGDSVVLRYGASGVNGFTLNNSGNISIGGSDLAGTSYKFFADGTGCFRHATFGEQLNILRNDSADSAIKYSNANGILGYIGVSSAGTFEFVSSNASVIPMTCTSAGALSTIASITATTYLSAGTYVNATTYVDTPKLNLSRVNGITGGRISFYRDSYYTWYMYMSTTAHANSSPTGATPPTGTYVTTWGLRSLIQNTAGMGWTWESCVESANATPSIIMELSSNTGNLKLNGSFTSTGDQTVSSDATLKTNLNDIALTSEQIANAPAVSFDWKDGHGHSFGSIAQYWKPLVPEAVLGEEGSYTLAYGQLGVVLGINNGKAIFKLEQHETEQDKEIRLLKEKVKKQAGEIRGLKKEIERLRMN